MRKSIIVSLCLFFITSITAQNFKFIKEFGDFNKGAAISVTPGNNVFASDIDKNEVYKFDKTGKQTNYIGGYGWDIEAFDEPIDIFATPLNVYVADKNNNRIQIFDRELNFLSVFKTHENESDQLSFSYPTCVGISTAGDLYILDSDNSRILKYDLTGNYLQQIGNYDSGSYKLNNPIKFSISRDGKIFVLDGSQIFVFDQFGTGISKIKIDKDVSNISIYDYNLTLISAKTLMFINLREISDGFSEFSPLELSDQESMQDAVFVSDRLFILTDIRILEYSLTK